MPAAMPGYVVKGAILTKIEAAANDISPNGRRAQMLQLLQARNPNGTWVHDLPTIGVTIAGFTATEAQHLKSHWFNHRYGWWPQQQPLEVVMRYGLIHAIGLADGTLPAGSTPTVRMLDFYWVCGIDNVGVTCCVSKNQVTTLVYTPAPPVSDRLPEDFPSTSHKEPIYTTRHQSLGPGEHEVALPQDWVEFVQPLQP